MNWSALFRRPKATVAPVAAGATLEFEDRRGHARLPRDQKVVVNLRTGQKLSARLLDSSASGVRLEIAGGPVVPGSQHFVDILFGGTAARFQINIMWCSHAGRGRHQVGARLLFLRHQDSIKWFDHHQEPKHPSSAEPVPEEPMETKRMGLYRAQDTRKLKEACS